jgi:hypothetical protein
VNNGGGAAVAEWINYRQQQHIFKRMPLYNSLRIIALEGFLYAVAGAMTI